MAAARLGEVAPVTTMECDVRRRDSVLEVARAIRAEHGPVDVLCANAGVSGPPLGQVWDTRIAPTATQFIIYTHSESRDLVAHMMRSLEATLDTVPAG